MTELHVGFYIPVSNAKLQNQQLTTVFTAFSYSTFYIKLSKQKQYFPLPPPPSYLLPHTVCKSRSVSIVAPNSQVKTLAQLLLQNAVDVFPKLNVHSKFQSFVEVGTSELEPCYCSPSE